MPHNTQWRVAGMLFHVPAGGLLIPQHRGDDLVADLTHLLA